MNLFQRNLIVGVSGMGWPSQRASKRALACLAVFGVGGIAGLLAGFSADPVQTLELSPAEIVALRFPGGPSQIASNHVALPPAPAGTDPDPAPAGYVLASAGETDLQASSLMFSPFPTYSTLAQSAAAQSAPARSNSTSSTRASSPPANSSLPPQLASADARIPAEALGYAAVDALVRPAPVVSAAPAPAKRASPQHPASPSNALLNSAQIASIKERLNLTSYQSTLWPPVESALRDISYAGRKAASSAHGGTIDPDSVPVQRLKSAAFPLIMSLSDDQKQEVRTMVRLMGLENLASQF
jgi:hypothetical protein